MRPLLSASLVSCLLSAAAVAQTPPNLFGTTLAPVSANILLHQSDHASCTSLGSCTTALGSNALNYWPGGSAWDSSTGFAWATNGLSITRQDLATCTVNVGPVACPRSVGSQATGLDVHDALGELWTIDSNGIITRSTNSPALTFITSHNTGLALAAGPTATSAISIDELRGLVFYSTCNFSGSGNIHVALMSNPAVQIQLPTPVQECFTNPSLITGLAADAGNSVLYWTNGRGTMRLPYTYNPAGPSVSFNFTAQTCCIQVAPFTDPYTDLSIKWGGATSSGTPCANGTCPSCPMVHTLRNAPLLGTILQLGLDLAPTNMPSWCVISFGSCAGGGTTFPPLCGPPLVNLSAAAITLGMNVTNPGVGCTGTTTFFLPLPSNPAFAGLPLASQCIGLCPPTGTTMSNCLSWVLQ